MNKYLIGIIILILMISSNKLSYFLGCNINKIMNNIYVTEFLTILIIYNSIKLFENKSEKIHLFHSIMLYLIFKFFTRMNKTFTIISLLIIGFLLLEDTFKNDEKQEKNKKKHSFSLEDKEKIVVGIIIVGFIYNVYLKDNQFGNKFTIIKFFFSNKCNNKIYN